MIYFASDFHLGAPNPEKSRERELKIVAWLDSISEQVSELFLVGDIFDMWFEYKTVVPKGFLRFLSKITQLRQRGVEIHLFSGNHDIWFFDYFSRELGIHIYHQPMVFERQGKFFFVGHGDGLGPHDTGYKMMKKVFRNRFCQFLFSWIHPDIGLCLAAFLSRRSRAAQTQKEVFVEAQKEWLFLYANRKLQELPHINFFVFGHRHLPLDLVLDNQQSRYINLGEWINFYSYAVFDQNNLHLKFYKD